MVRIEADAVRWQAHRADFDDAATGKPEYLKRDLDKIETAESIAAALAANLVREYGDEIAGLIANAVNDQIGF